jgi:class 3 adenylate cyclase
MSPFFREFLTGIDGPLAPARRIRAAAWIRLLVIVPGIFLPTVRTMVLDRGSHAPELASVMSIAWLVQVGLYLVALLTILVANGRLPRLERLLTYACLILELSTSQLVQMGLGSLSTPGAVFPVVSIAVHRVFLDYRMALCAAVVGWVLFAGTALLELSGLLPLSPFLSYPLVHPAYTEPGAGVTTLVVSAVAMFIAFGATNYGMNQSWKLHRYITESVLRRYLPPSLVAKAAEGELQLDAKPERRTVTVMFTDIVGFTALSERLGAEAVGEVLNRCLSHIADVAHLHGATIDKFIGDAVMIVFGAPEPMTPADQARACVTLALEIHATLPALHEDLALQARTGINTGEAVVGNFGSEVRSDYTVLGPPVNVAARLETASKPGRILVGPETAALLEGAFPLEPAQALTLKGVSEPVAAAFVAEEVTAVVAA